MFVSDRVVVMGNRPGRIKSQVAVDLTRPREYELTASREFRDLYGQVRGSIHDESIAAATSR